MFVLVSIELEMYVCKLSNMKDYWSAYKFCNSEDYKQKLSEEIVSLIFDQVLVSVLIEI